jgi:hypothetical protein
MLIVALQLKNGYIVRSVILCYVSPLNTKIVIPIVQSINQKSTKYSTYVTMNLILPDRRSFDWTIKYLELNINLKNNNWNEIECTAFIWVVRALTWGSSSCRGRVMLCLIGEKYTSYKFFIYVFIYVFMTIWLYYPT